MSVIDLSENPLDNGFLPPQQWFVEKILGFCSGLTLDLGCGRGAWSRILRERERRVISLDLSQKRLNMCRSEGNNDVLVRSSSNRLPFKSSSFDTVLFIEVIEHMNEEDQNKTFQEIRRVLKNNGHVIVTTPNKHIYFLLSKIIHLYDYNPEHIHDLSLGEAKSMIKKYFKLTSVDGKSSGRRFGFLDKITPTFLCWDILLVGEKI